LGSAPCGELVAPQPGQGFGAQVVELFAGAVRGVAQRVERLGARQQEIALDQLREAEIRVHREQRVDLRQRVAQPVLADAEQAVHQHGFRCVHRAWRRGGMRG
jgi:hypothetical protein